MNEEQIRYWAKEGIEFGAHSRTHSDLRWLDRIALEEEVKGSKKDLEHILGSTVVAFAYPYGAYNDNVCASVEDVFKLGFTVDEGLNDLGTEHRLLRRMSVSNTESLFELRFRLRHGYIPLKNVRSGIRLRSRLKHVENMSIGQREKSGN
jgi:peptidoglycan/xylan/chitin deacetylase (PgdA/CDA1 family)